MAPEINFDVDGDGKVSQQDIEQQKEMLAIERAESKAETQKKMAGIALGTMICYALIPLIPGLSADSLSTISAMSDMLFLSQASIVGFYFGAQAYMTRK